jgi:LPXTG-motif cell wall-anchored protein
LIKVDVKWTVARNAFSATLWCDPSRHWAIIKSCVRSVEQNYEINRYVKFDPLKSNEFPVVTYMRREARIAGDRVVELWEWTFAQSDYGRQRPVGEFRLSAFGLPEPPGISWGGEKWYVLAGIFGLLAIGGGLLAKRRQRVREIGRSRGTLR